VRRRKMTSGARSIKREGYSMADRIYHLNKPKPDDPEPQKPTATARTFHMPWGKYGPKYYPSGMLLWMLTDDYLKDLESGFSRQKWGRPVDQQSFKVKPEIMEFAREALKSRGYSKKGERWIRD
jgi:hypothetical protein